MIIKSFEINKINLDLNNIFLLYGKNNGFKNEFTKNIKRNFASSIREKLIIKIFELNDN